MSIEVPVPEPPVEELDFYHLTPEQCLALASGYFARLTPPLGVDNATEHEPATLAVVLTKRPTKFGERALPDHGRLVVDRTTVRGGKIHTEVEYWKDPAGEVQKLDAWRDRRRYDGHLTAYDELQVTPEKITYRNGTSTSASMNFSPGQLIFVLREADRLINPDSYSTLA